MNKPIKITTTSNAAELLNSEKWMDIIQDIYQGKSLLGSRELLMSLVKSFTQIALQDEMEAHLSDSSLGAGTSRHNGISSKTTRCASGSFELEVPKNRNNSFKPPLW